MIGHGHTLLGFLAIGAAELSERGGELDVDDNVLMHEVCIVRGGAPGRRFTTDVLNGCAERAHWIAGASILSSFETAERAREGRV